MNKNCLVPALALMAALLAASPAGATITVLNDWRMGENDSGAVSGAPCSNTVDLVRGNTLTNTQAGGLYPVYTNSVSALATAESGSTLALVLTNGQYGTAALATNATDNFGIECWVNPATTSAGGRVLAYNGLRGNGWGLYQGGTNFEVLYGGETFFGSAPATAGVWTHLALVRSSGTAILYANGVPVSTNSSTTPLTPAGSFTVGGDAQFGEYFSGSIDEVRVFTFAPGAFSTNDLLINSTNAPAFGSRLSLDGSGDYVSVANFGNIIPTNEITVEFWANATTNGGAAFILQPDQYPTNRFAAFVPYVDGYAYWEFGNVNSNGEASVGEPAGVTNNWIHYALVASQSGNYMAIYTNGVLMATNTGMSPFVRGSYSLSIGGSPGQYFGGAIDEFRVWSFARTQAEIQADLGTPLVGNEAGLLLYYRFDSTNGTVATNSATATGAAFNGSLQNTATWTSAPTPPATVTATGITTSSEMFSGIVYPGTNNAKYYFQYGTTTNYGGTTPLGNPSAVANLYTPVGVSNSITGLIPYTLYHFRVVMTNNGTTVPGQDSTFIPGPVWAQLSQPLPGPIGVMLLLSDGTVMAKQDQNGPYTPYWFRLTPDIHGSYLNGTWSTNIAPMHANRHNFASTMLKDSRVLVAGGEQGNGQATSEVYDPVSDTWTVIPVSTNLLNPALISPPYSTLTEGFDDANSVILPDGRVLVAPVGIEYTGETLMFDPVGNSWAAGPILFRGDNEDESCWVKLPDDSILTIDPFGTNSERYLPALGSWVNDGNVPVPLYDSFGMELGPSFLLPNGKAIFFGSTTNNAFYTPSGNASPGSWSAATSFPNGQGMPDAPGAMMINGKILLAVSPTPFSGDNFPTPTSFYEYDYLGNSFARVAAPGGGLTIDQPSFVFAMLDLPDGTVIMSPFGSNVYVYSPLGAPLAAGKPAVQSVSFNADGSLHLTGTLFNGITQGAMFGDDEQMDGNYPIVRFTDLSGSVRYGRSYNWSSTGVMTGKSIVSTECAIPAGGSLQGTIQVVANGNASDPVNVVTSISDSGPGSLRATIGQTSPGGHIIFLSSLAGQTITLTGGEITLSNNVSIDASALSNNITISGNHSSRIFLINQGLTVTLGGLNVTGANGAGAAPLANYGGAIFNQGNLTLNDCYFYSNSGFAGGAVYNRGTTAGILTVNGCTFAGNSASYGGAIQNEGTMSAVNSTFTANTCTQQGGAIDAPFSAPTALTQCTVSANTAADGGGYYGTALSVTNTILAGNAATTHPDLDGSLSGGGNNLTNGSSALAPLDYYGGPTPTMPPMYNSPAVNSGNVAAAGGIPTDQRGLPRVVSGHVDIGAFETQISDKNPVVTSLADSGYGSLRQAVANLATFGSANPITFAPALSGTTLPLASEITITSNVTIDASGLPAGLTLSGGGKTRILSVLSGTASLVGVTFVDGNSVGSVQSGSGGAIYDAATLFLAKCTLSNNHSVSDAGALLVQGTATLSQCALFSNQSGADGGAITAKAGSFVNLFESTLAGNLGGLYGGAIYCVLGSLNLQDCTLASNTAVQAGGGGITENSGSANLVNCVLAGNTSHGSAGPNVYNAGGQNTTSHVLIDNNADSGIDATNGNLVGTSGSPLNALLAPLGPWGGPTLSMPPLPGSPAIDAGINHGATVDQRGSARFVGSNPDMGAVESGGLWVQTNFDTGSTSLRSVIAFAEGVSGPYYKEVLFVPSLSGANVSLSSQLLITDPYGIVIDASALPGGVQINPGGHGRAFFITNNASATLKSLSIINGLVPGGSISSGGGGGAIFCQGSISLLDCFLMNNRANIFSTTVAAYAGAIANNGGSVGLTNCTLAFNQAQNLLAGGAYAGAFYNLSGTMTLDHCTVVSNTAATSVNGGFADGGTTYLRATVLDNGNTDFNNLGGGVSLGENFISDGTSSGLTDGVNGDQVGTSGNPLDALLAPVGYYGGPTETLPPLPGSPLVDAAPAYTGLPTDQRGYPRPIGLAADIGAVEGIYLAAAPMLKSAARLRDGSIQVNLTNYPDASFQVLTATNVTQPMSTWAPIGFTTETPGGSGLYQFIDPQASSNYPQRYYRVSNR